MNNDDDDDDDDHLLFLGGSLLLHHRHEMHLQRRVVAAHLTKHPSQPLILHIHPLQFSLKLC